MVVASFLQSLCALFVKLTNGRVPVFEVVVSPISYFDCIEYSSSTPGCLSLIEPPLRYAAVVV